MAKNLPWEEKAGGKCIADAGTVVFFVVLKGEGWECSAKEPGEKAKVLASGLPTVTAAKRVAHQAAATSGPKGPKKAAKKARKKAAKAAAKTASKSDNPATAEPQAAKKVAKADAPAPALPIEVVSDGCICGRVEGVRWVADPKGNIEWLSKVSPSAEASVKAFVADRFAAKQGTATHPEAEGPRRKPGRPRKDEKPTPEPEPAKVEAPARRKPGRPRKDEAKVEAPAKPKPEAPRRKPGRPRKDAQPEPERRKPGRPRKDEAKVEAPAKPEAPRRKPGRPRKDSGEQKPVEATQPEVRRKPGRPRKDAQNAAEPAANDIPGLKWRDIEGRRQASTSDGSWQILAEGSQEALYYYDATGAARYIQSGTRDKLEQIAAERHARGGMGAAPKVPAMDALFDSAMRNGKK